METVTRERQKESTRRRILDAAREEFTRVGYAGASIVDIGKKAGITHAAVYRHFPSKLEVFRALLASQRHLRVPGLMEVEAEPDARRALFLFAIRWLESFRTDRDWAQLVKMCLLNEELYRGLNRDVDLYGDSGRSSNTEALVIRLVSRLAEAGELRSGPNPAREAAVYLDLLKTVASRRLLEFEGFREPLTDRDVARAAVAYLTAGEVGEG